MKKSSTHSTSDEWVYEADELTPLTKATLSVSGNGTKTGNCVLYFCSGASSGTPTTIILATLLEAQALATQLSIIVSQWEERLGNSQRA